MIDDGIDFRKNQINPYISNKGVTTIDTSPDTQIQYNANNIDDGLGLSNANGENITPRTNPGVANNISIFIKVSIIQRLKIITP